MPDPRIDIPPAPPAPPPPPVGSDGWPRPNRSQQARAGAASATARLARTGSAAPPAGAKGRAAQSLARQALIMAYAPHWSEATLAAQADALLVAYLSARRRKVTTLSLESWAPGWLRRDGGR